MSTTEAPWKWKNMFSRACLHNQPAILSLLLVLMLYAVLDLSFHFYSNPTTTFESVEDLEDPICQSIEGHMGTGDQPPAWKMMKWVGNPAPCKVKGHLLERLDPEHNFRRGFALRFATDVEDRTHVIPWLLGTKVNLNYSPRRVYLDLGGNRLETSILWFLRMYPCDFNEVHVFEADHDLLQRPSHGFEENSNTAEPNPLSFSTKHVSGIPQWMLDRIHIYYSYVSDKDDPQGPSINITRFIKEELKLKAGDSVVVKMDIENYEWPILRRWINDPEMADIIDELFVEIHYADPSMSGYGWDGFVPYTRHDALLLYAELRLHGFYVHPWP